VSGQPVAAVCPLIAPFRFEIVGKLIAYFGSLAPRLPLAVWTLQAGGLANAFGSGVVVPFAIIYLHDVRGISLTVAGLAASASALGALPAGAAGGALADRFGPRRILSAALLVQAVAIACFPWIRAGWHAVVLQLALGAGGGAFWPAQSSLLALVTPDDQRHVAFAQQRVAVNLGFGIGGVVAGAIAVASEPATFTILFAIDAVTFLAFAILLARVPSPHATHHEAAGGSYAAVLRDRAFVGLFLLNTLFVAAGIVPLLYLLPVYAKNVAGVSEQAIGLIFFANTITIVLIQLRVARVLEGRRRMRAFALMGAVWSATWLAVVATVETLDATAVAFVLAGAAAVLGAAECVHGAVHGPLVADLAPPAMLGRYMALGSLSWQLAFVVGPAIGGALLDAHRVGVWILVSVACAAAAAWSLVLERSLPPQARRTPAAGAAAPQDAPLTTAYDA
jgi:MFS family permease